MADRQEGVAATERACVSAGETVSAAFGRGRRRPPLRRCPRCGGQHCAWQEQALCQRCRRETQPDSSALVGLVRQARLERREGLELPAVLPGQMVLPGIGNPPDAEIPY